MITSQKLANMTTIGNRNIIKQIIHFTDINKRRYYLLLFYLNPLISILVSRINCETYTTLIDLE